MGDPSGVGRGAGGRDIVTSVRQGVLSVGKRVRPYFRKGLV